VGYPLHFDHVFYFSLAEGLVQLGLSACSPSGSRAVEAKAGGLFGEDVL
jgi:hypothetical protein